ncbi:MULTISPECIES: DUF1702 family protein [Micromonospora]|uniref:DUF1702 family protein n=1 Tax=Micromonospora TaxID=1873 RepID=UPI0006AE6BE5|nr:DUF1702 family protein [Micromonospora sp. NRRL B-16802]KOX03142.1 enediyne biosynthesis protein [Micromonospora sp. NRRL B-16802]
MGVSGKLRRRILTPDVSETKLDVRGFHVKNPQARELLETVGASFLRGFGYAAEASAVADAERELESVPFRFRGFAYEGAAMGFAIRDGLRLGRPRYVSEMLAGRGDAHVYMAYVGVGWAMARLPRLRWSTLTAPDRLLRWLVLDGYGFHQAYFHTDRYVRQQYREKNFPWPLDEYRWYADHAIDQGIGRALWFVGGTDPGEVARMIEAYQPERRADLWSGTGLAATYAGGGDEEELRALWRLAGEHRPQLAQGAAFAAGARVRAGLLGPHTELATQIFCGMSAEQAQKVTDEALVDLPDGESLPSWEIWRQRITASFVSLGQC